MAGIGLKRFKYAKLNNDGTYGPVKTLAEAIECKVSLDLSEAMLYADDVIKEQVSIFKSGFLLSFSAKPLMRKPALLSQT